MCQKNAISGKSFFIENFEALQQEYRSQMKLPERMFRETIIEWI